MDSSFCVQNLIFEDLLKSKGTDMSCTAYCRLNVNFNNVPRAPAETLSSVSSDELDLIECEVLIAKSFPMALRRNRRVVVLCVDCFFGGFVLDAIFTKSTFHSLSHSLTHSPSSESVHLIWVSHFLPFVRCCLCTMRYVIHCARFARFSVRLMLLCSAQLPLLSSHFFRLCNLRHCTIKVEPNRQMNWTKSMPTNHWSLLELLFFCVSSLLLLRDASDRFEWINCRNRRKQMHRWTTAVTIETQQICSVQLEEQSLSESTTSIRSHMRATSECYHLLLWLLYENVTMKDYVRKDILSFLLLSVVDVDVLRSSHCSHCSRFFFFFQKVIDKVQLLLLFLFLFYLPWKSFVADEHVRQFLDCNTHSYWFIA